MLIGHARYFYGKPGHEFVVLRGSESHALCGTDWSRDVQLLDGCDALLSKAPKTGWAGMFKSAWGDHMVYCQEAPTPQQAAELVSRAMAEDRAEAERRSDPAYLLEALLKAHDWYAHYSDDYNVTRASDRHWLRIQEVLTRVPENVGQALVEKYRPKV